LYKSATPMKFNSSNWLSTKNKNYEKNISFN
jgi:hypothetical protein